MMMIDDPVYTRSIWINGLRVAWKCRIFLVCHNSILIPQTFLSIFRVIPHLAFATLHISSEIARQRNPWLRSYYAPSLNPNSGPRLGATHFRTINSRSSGPFILILLDTVIRKTLVKMPKKGLLERLAEGPVIGDGGFVFAMEKRGYVKAGPWTPEVVMENPEAGKLLSLF